MRPESALVNLKICISNSVESKSHNQFIAEHQAHLPNASSQECLFHVTSKRNRMKSSKNRDVVVLESPGLRQSLREDFFFPPA